MLTSSPIFLFCFIVCVSFCFIYLCIFFNNSHKEMMEDAVLRSVGVTLETTVGRRTASSIFLFLQLFLWWQSAQKIPQTQNNNKQIFFLRLRHIMMFSQYNSCQCWTLINLRMLTLPTKNPRHFQQRPPHTGEMWKGADHIQECAAFGNSPLYFTSQATSPHFVSLSWLHSEYHSCTSSMPLAGLLPKGKRYRENF